ncbi:hypothetical protein EV128_101501 [Rhizobium azibense]|nr:hypothetical protein EV128_101501 [Rhizobium azibense]
MTLSRQLLAGAPGLFTPVGDRRIRAKKATPIIANLTSIDCVKTNGNAPAGIVARQRS